MKKKIIIIVVIILVVAAISLLKKRKADMTKASVAQVLPVVVNGMTLRSSKVTLTVPALGVVASGLSSTLSTKVSGYVLKVFHQEGDVVEKGEKLAVIDANELTAKRDGLRLKMQGVDYQIASSEENVKALNVSLAAAQETHAITLALLKVKGASLEQSRQEEATIAGVEAKKSTAKNGMATLKKGRDSLAENIKEVEFLAAYATITAPIAGTVSKRFIMPGDLATPGRPLFKIAANTGLYVNLSLPGNLKPHGVIFHGKELLLTAKNEASSAGLGQYLAPLSPDAGVVEGQYVSVLVVVYEGENVLIPTDGLLSVGDSHFVFIRTSDKTVKTRVEILARGSEGVVVKSDLVDRMIILAKPDILLRASSGVPVLVSEFK